MNFGQLQELITTTYNKITYDSNDLRDAEIKASEFLAINAQIISMKLELQSYQVRLISLQDAVYKDAVMNAGGKNVTESKLIAEATKDYQLTRENVENINAQLDYLKHFIDLFNNAHIFYRQLSKGV